MTGLALATDLSGRYDVMAAAVVAMWAMGVAFVTCRWVLETMCFATLTDGGAVWRTRKGQAREHTIGLVRWVPHQVDTDQEDACAWRALEQRTPITAPWNLAALVGGGSAALAGSLLVGGPGAAALLVGVLGALLLTRVEGHRGWVAVAAAGCLMAVAGSPAGALPLLVVLLGYTFFTHQCADEVGKPLRRIAAIRGA